MVNKDSCFLPCDYVLKTSCHKTLNCIALSPYLLAPYLLKKINRNV